MKPDKSFLNRRVSQKQPDWYAALLKRLYDVEYIEFAVQKELGHENYE